MTRVLVTGAAGFTGRYVVPLLAQAGYEVHGLSRAQCDIRDARAAQEALRASRPDRVLHLAGTPSLPDAQRETLFAVNAQATENLLAACAMLDTAPSQILLASSCYVYGDTGGVPADENAPLEPDTEYGRSKLAMEAVARRWMPKLPIVIVRPFNYTGIGHGERFLVPKLVRAFHERGDDVSFVQPGIQRDFSDVRSVAAAYVALLDAGEAGTAYNICSGVGTPLQSLIDVLERLTAHRPGRRQGAAKGPPRGLVGSPERLRKLPGVGASIALEETLRWMLAGDSGPGAAA